MKVGIAIQDTWNFFHEIYADLSAHHETSLFERRTLNLPFFNGRFNQYLFRHDLQAFMQDNDVVFFEWASGLLAVATHLRKTCGIVTRLHRYEMYQWAEQVNWDVVDSIILVSEAKRREFVERFPDHLAKATVVPEAVSLDRFQPSAKPFTGDIGILCQLTPRKRVYELILTFYELKKVRSDLRLHIAGSPRPAHKDYYPALLGLVRKLGIAEDVVFYGHVAQPAEWYHQIDVFVSNSYSEGLQVALLEAMASGVYCFSHRWDGVEELLPAENLYASGGELQKRLLHYCELNEAARRELRCSMREIVGNGFDVEQTKVQIRHVVEDVARERERSKVV